MHLTHLVGILGLIFNTVGAGMLLWFPPDVQRYSSEGGYKGDWTSVALPENKHMYARQQRGFRVAIGCFILGFALQGTDLLIA